MRIINLKDIEKTKREIKQSKKPILVKAQDDNFNRSILEYGKFDILVFPQTEKSAKDKAKQLDSGLNHVLAAIASKNKVSIGIDLDEIRKLEKKDKAKTLARLSQNIKICRKAKVKIILLNYKDKLDSFNLMISLGASTQQIYFSSQDLYSS